MSLESSLCWFFSDMNRVLCHLSVGLTGSISVTDPCSTASWHMAPAQLEANYMTDESLKSLTHICMHFSSEECTEMYNFCTSQQASPISPHLSVSLLVFFSILMTSPFWHSVHLSQCFHFIKVSALPSKSYYCFINKPQIWGINRLNSIWVESPSVQTVLRTNVSLFATDVIYYKYRAFCEPQAWI